MHDKNIKLEQAQDTLARYADQVQSFQATKYDTCIDMVQKNSFLDQQVIQLKNEIHTLKEDKQDLESEIGSTKDHLKSVIENKLSLETQLHNFERVSC